MVQFVGFGLFFGFAGHDSKPKRSRGAPLVVPLAVVEVVEVDADLWADNHRFWPMIPFNLRYQLISLFSLLFLGAASTLRGTYVERK